MSDPVETDRPVTRPSLPVWEWLNWPPSYLIFWLLALLLVAYTATMDRAFLLDQENYINYFTSAAADDEHLDWVQTASHAESFLQTLIVQLFSEELLWGLWTAILGPLLDPTAAVRLTVCLLNTLIIASAWRSDGRLLSLTLWAVLPVGFAVTGLIQIRQGFALAIILFLALQFRRPLLGSILAGMIHTTFVVTFIFVFVQRILGGRRRLALVATFALAFAGAYLGGMVFELVGGRRLQVYSADEGATSINYVLGSLICIVPSLYWLISAKPAEVTDRDDGVMSALAIGHVGTTAFTIFSFFLFPLGTSRVGYLTQLLLIPILPAVWRRRDGAVPLAILALVGLYVIYLSGKSYLEGAYAIFLGI